MRTCKSCHYQDGIWCSLGDTCDNYERWTSTGVEVTGKIDPKSSYYDAGGIVTLDYIKAKLTPEQYKGFLLGNILKYSSRLNFKGVAARDAEKVSIYANELKELDS